MAVMTLVGITGHRHIPAAALAPVVAGIHQALEVCDQPVTGYSSLAIGADQLFAQALLEQGGRLVAVLPCLGYEMAFQGEGLQTFKTLLKSADELERLDFLEPSPEAYLAAGREIVRRCAVIIAVWDGRPARGLGGTADVVHHALSSGKRVEVIWPEGLTR